VAVCPPAEIDAITTYPAVGLEQEVVISPPVAEPEVAVCPPMEIDATITTYPAGGFEQEVVISPPITEPVVAVCPPAEVDATITTYPAGGLEQEVVIAPPTLEAEVAVCPPAEDVQMEDDEADAFDFFTPEPIGSRARDLEREQELASLKMESVAVCPPAEVDATITTYPAGGLEQEVVISPPIAEPEVAVCPPAEMDATITTYPAGGLEQEVVICPPALEAEVAVVPPAEDEKMEEEEADAFDFFTPEPIGSRARDLEREQELALSAASNVSMVSTTSAEASAGESTWITETESVIITTTTTTTTIAEDGTVIEKKEVSVTSQPGDAVETTTDSAVAATTYPAGGLEQEVVAAAGLPVAAAAVPVAAGLPAEVVHPVATFYTEEMRATAGATGEIVEEGFRVVGPEGGAVPDQVLEEAGHPEKQ